MDRIIDILGRRNGRGSFIFLLTCVIGSYDRLIGKNIFISCRPLLVYRMTPVPLRLFHKNLGNLQVFFFGKVVDSFTPPPPPRQQMAPTGTHDSIGEFDPLLNITDNSVIIYKLRQDKSGQALTCSGECFCGL